MATEILLGHADFIELKDEGWKSLIDFTEYRVNSVDDVEKCRKADSFCVAHLPDSLHPDWRTIAEALAEVSQVGLINVHARAEDEYLLCYNCQVRLVNMRRAGQRCDYCGTVLDPEQSDPALRQNTTKELIERLNWAHELFRSKKKTLTIENTYDPPDVLRRILDQLPRDVRFTLDVGHALIYHGSPLDYIYLLRDRLVHLHLHDNMGGNSERYHDSHLPAGAGIANWYAIAGALKQVGFRGTATFECFTQLDWVKNWLRLLSDEDRPILAKYARMLKVHDFQMDMRKTPANNKDRKYEVHRFAIELAMELVSNRRSEELRELFQACVDFDFYSRWKPRVLCGLIRGVREIDPAYAPEAWSRSLDVFQWLHEHDRYDFLSTIPEILQLAKECDWLDANVSKRFHGIIQSAVLASSYGWEDSHLQDCQPWMEELESRSRESSASTTIREPE